MESKKNIFYNEQLRARYFLSVSVATRDKNVIGTNHTVRLTIWHLLFLELWLVDTWFFTHPRDQRAVARLENVRQLTNS